MYNCFAWRVWFGDTCIEDHSKCFQSSKHATNPSQPRVSDHDVEITESIDHSRGGWRPWCTMLLNAHTVLMASGLKPMTLEWCQPEVLTRCRRWWLTATCVQPDWSLTNTTNTGKLCASATLLPRGPLLHVPPSKNSNILVDHPPAICICLVVLFSILSILCAAFVCHIFIRRCLVTWGSYRLLRIQWLSQLYSIRLQVPAASSSRSTDFLLLGWLRAVRGWSKSDESPSLLVSSDSKEVYIYIVRLLWT